MLSCYRILDLTDEKGFICGRALSDFGADVVKIEKPDGDPARNKGPFYHDIADPEKNLNWFAFNANKRGITLDIETVEGQEIFKELVKKADVVIESFAPGYLDKLGLGYSALSEINPGIIMTSITGFGQEGPYRNYKDPDIVVRALGGCIYTVGEDDRPPLGVSYQHTHLIGAMHGAVGTMVALAHRHITGRGQHVDAPTQQGLVFVCSAEIEGPYELFGEILSRHGKARGSVQLKGGDILYNPVLWECKNGYIAFNLLLSPVMAKNNKALVECMKRDGIDIGFLEHWEWDKMGWGDLTPKGAEELFAMLGKFFMKYTKAELFELALANRFQLAPCHNAEDSIKFSHLIARDFWKEVDHPELGTSITYPGASVWSTAAYCGIRHRAPLIGEHNEEVYQKELGMSAEEISNLKGKKII